MKKLWPVIMAILAGSILALFLFRGVEKQTKEKVVGNAVAIQIGVFTKKENAESLMNSVGGMVLEDEGLYRVYYSILQNKENVDFITNYLKNKGVSYYLKKITLSDSAIGELEGIEALLDKTSGDGKIEINKKLLKEMKEVI